MLCDFVVFPFFSPEGFGSNSEQGALHAAALAAHHAHHHFHHAAALALAALAATPWLVGMVDAPQGLGSAGSCWIPSRASRLWLHLDLTETGFAVKKSGWPASRLLAAPRPHRNRFRSAMEDAIGNFQYKSTWKVTNLWKMPLKVHWTIRGATEGADRHADEVERMTSWAARPRIQK